MHAIIYIYIYIILDKIIYIDKIYKGKMTFKFTYAFWVSNLGISLDKSDIPSKYCTIFTRNRSELLYSFFNM